MKTKKQVFRKILYILLCLCFIGVSGFFIINGVVKSATRDRIIQSDEAATLKDVDCILVLGCGVRDNGEPSDMLHDRLMRSIELYNLSAAPKLLMSGDHGRVNYDEVAVMKQFAVDHGILSQNVFMDHAGFSTYESLYRVRDVFQADKILIVTQEYHLYRALYIAEQLGIDAYGVSADYHTYAGQLVRDCREILARTKDCIKCIFQPKPTFTGEAIPFLVTEISPTTALLTFHNRFTA